LLPALHHTGLISLFLSSQALISSSATRLGVYMLLSQLLPACAPVAV
jgi:hypothetical protein